MLPPDAVLAAHLEPRLAQQKSQLNARLQTTQALNARLFADVRRQRAEAEAIVALLQRALGDVDAANDALAAAADGADGAAPAEGAGVGVGVADELARETRAVEVEMASVAAAAAAAAAAGVSAGSR